MQITVFAIRIFNDVGWKEWEHACDEGEIEAIVDSARTFAFDHALFRAPLNTDYLKGVRHIFDVARGSLSEPVHGDMRVYGVKVTEATIEQFVEPLSEFSSKMRV